MGGALRGPLGLDKNFGVPFCFISEKLQHLLNFLAVTRENLKEILFKQRFFQFGC